MSSVAEPISGASSTLEERLRKTGLIIPTFNAGPFWATLQAALDRQGIARSQVLVVDSSSSDNTRALVTNGGYPLMTIRKEKFRHGLTRQLAAEHLCWAETLLYLTQDAIPCGADSIKRLLRAFDDPAVGAAYGRQLARANAGPIELHGRLFNYPAVSDVRSFATRTRLGLRTTFFSNSFAAYRRTALEAVGGFPRHNIVSEEVTVAARMLLAGWKTAYQADATITHSHALGLREEFSRYFDIGVHRGRERELLEPFGKADGEGLAFVLSEMRFLLRSKPSLIPFAAVRDMSKWIAYHLGLQEKRLPFRLKQSLSLQPQFWLDERVVRPADEAGPKRLPSP